MKLAVISESPADDAAVRVLVDAILGRTSEIVEVRSLRRRSGYSSLPALLEVAIPELHFNTDADALVLVVDSNGTPIHVPEHERPGGAVPECRLCSLRAAAARLLGRLKPRGHHAPLNVAIGLASPPVEAWYRCGIDPQATEAAWARDLAAGARAPERIRGLKRDVYGTDRPGLPLETGRATEAAGRLAQQLVVLEQHFPSGFGSFARDIRAWRACPEA
jgi:hypothetical protein